MFTMTMIHGKKEEVENELKNKFFNKFSFMVNNENYESLPIYINCDNGNKIIFSKDEIDNYMIDYNINDENIKLLENYVFNVRTKLELFGLIKLLSKLKDNVFFISNPFNLNVITLESLSSLEEYNQNTKIIFTKERQ